MAIIEDDRDDAVPAVLTLREGGEVPVFVESFEEGEDLMTIRLVVENAAGDVEAELVLSRYDLTHLWFVPQRR